MEAIKKIVDELRLDRDMALRELGLAKAHIARMCNESARQAGAQEGVTTISVTPEMINAATEVLHESGYLEYTSPSDRALVEDMLRAALVQRERESTR